MSQESQFIQRIEQTGQYPIFSQLREQMDEAEVEFLGRVQVKSLTHPVN